MEEARKLVAEFDAWLASAPPLPDVGTPAEPDHGGPGGKWETTADLAVRVVGILRHDGGPLRARDIIGDPSGDRNVVRVREPGVFGGRSVEGRA